MLDNIGFYTLTEERAKNSSTTSPLWRCELLLTDKCNLKCPYCRGMKKELQGELPFTYVQQVLQLWIEQGLRNVRFSGGEPTIYPYLKNAIKECKKGGVKRIALSTNGTQSLDFYKELVDLGVNDFSVSLDGGCCAVSNKMTGGINSFEVVSKNIKYLSWYNYVTVGVVFNELNIDTATETVKYVDSLNPSDIRIISSAQYNKALSSLVGLSDDILNRHPILKYRISNYKNGRNVRGICEQDTNKCHLVKDDVAVAGKWHFPCIIYLREGGNPIGEMNKSFRQDRIKWFKNHDTHKDPICKNNCLDVCIDYNNTTKPVEE
jgi:molybdenum cofactor biosynthesis enzyme MoaA